jgi:uncharacterized protein (TIGR02246 family)
MSGDDLLLDRVRRLEDLEEIQNLFFEYKRALDGKDFKAYAELFTADGEFVAGEIRAQGRDGIRSLVEAMLGNLLGAELGQDFHLVVNPSIELDRQRPDRATAEVTWLYVVRGDDGEPKLSKLGHYEDSLVRDGDGRWRFQTRNAPTDIPVF